MKTQTILKAMETLDKAAKALRLGRESVEEQMRIGMDCYRAETALRKELVADVPTVKVKDAA